MRSKPDTRTRDAISDLKLRYIVSNLSDDSRRAVTQRL